MDNILQLLIKSNTLNFLAVAVLLIFLSVKLNLKQKIEVLRDDIKEYVESAEEERKNAESELDKIKNKISKLPEEIKSINDSADNSVENIGKKIQAEIEEQKKDIENSTKRIFNLETKKFKSKLTNTLSEKSVEIAEENALKQLNLNKSLHNKYINNAIEELDRIIL